MFAINAMCPEVIGYREPCIHKLREVVSVRNMCAFASYCVCSRFDFPFPWRNSGMLASMFGKI